jgi:hypothetical protein
MSQEKSPRSAALQDSQRHADWVREHPRIEESGFSEYPDDPQRRGASRGATPNGNPWRPVNPDERPGRVGSHTDVAAAPGAPPPADTSVFGQRNSASSPSPASALDDDANAPPNPAQPAVVRANNEADARIGRAVAEILADAKSLEGAHLVVQVVEGEVYLRGTVADQSVKNEAEQLASSVRTVKRIHNMLNAVRR